MTRTVVGVCLFVAAVCAGCAPEPAEAPAPQPPAAQPSDRSEQPADSSVVAAEGFESGSSETLAEARETPAGQPAEAP